MTDKMNNGTESDGLVFVTGGTGKTGRRIVELLEEKGVPVRIGSRSARPPFEWDNPKGWNDCLEGVNSIYVSYSPDLAIPGAKESISTLLDLAQRSGVERVVLLSGRGESEAQACEELVRNSGLEWTVVRASWFNQNFSEGAFTEMVLSGQITLPAGEAQEPFVDVDDIAEVAVAALTEVGHDGEVYEVTGPRLMSFDEVASDLSKATGREIEYADIPHEAFVEHVKGSGAPKDVVWLMDYLFSTVLDGRNSVLADGVERALGRPPRDFSEYAHNTAASGVWETSG
ncbi:MAG: NAD(P)H-binding protein [Aridibacter famidurans]|nr:NAD(P)H-binding protein [Aridibacter famidurans]